MGERGKLEEILGEVLSPENEVQGMLTRQEECNQFHNRIYPEQIVKVRGGQESAVTDAAYRSKESKLE